MRLYQHPPYITKASGKHLVIALLCTMLTGYGFAQQLSQTQLIKQADWLIGSWSNQTPGALFMEVWTKQNDSTYLGSSYTLANQDTVSAEKVRLEQRNGHLYYIPTVKKQNNGMPVPFALTTATGGYLSFENPQHDFPQKITYQLISKDSLVAEISGISKGKARAISFPMKRAN